jgi:hypothetical protein
MRPVAVGMRSRASGVMRLDAGEDLVSHGRALWACSRFLARDVGRAGAHPYRAVTPDAQERIPTGLLAATLRRCGGFLWRLVFSLRRILIF